jgi:hypothetical protein
LPTLLQAEIFTGHHDKERDAKDSFGPNEDEQEKEEEEDEAKVEEKEDVVAGVHRKNEEGGKREKMRSVDVEMQLTDKKAEQKARPLLAGKADLLPTATHMRPLDRFVHRQKANGTAVALQPHTV